MGDHKGRPYKGLVEGVDEGEPPLRDAFVNGDALVATSDPRGGMGGNRGGGVGGYDDEILRLRWTPLRSAQNDM